MSVGNSIKWEKGDIYDNFIFRSSSAKQYKNAIQQQHKYQARKRAYLVENNPLNINHQYNEKELQSIGIFFNNNNESNLDPFIQIENNKWKPLNNVLNSRRIVNPELNNLPKLLSQQTEVCAAITIPKGTLLGQYVGCESTKTEWDNMYRGEKMRQLKYRMQYLCYERVLFEQHQLEIFVDPMECVKMNHLHRINDCRANISCVKLTEQDKQRQNCELISVLVNGWPTTLVRTTKTITAYKSLWLDYGTHSGLIFAGKATVIGNKPDVILKSAPKVKKEAKLKGSKFEVEALLDFRQWLSKNKNKMNEQESEDSLSNILSKLDAMSDSESDNEGWDVI